MTHPILFCSQTPPLISLRCSFYNIASRSIASSVAEFLRVLKAGGIALAQVPSGFKPRPTLPNSGCRGRITLPTRELVTHPNLALTLNVWVRNESDVLWPTYPSDKNDFGRLRLGNHWRDANGSVIQLDDGRVDLPPVLPGEEVAVSLTVTTPSVEGRFILEVDLVEECVTWFAQRGLATPRIAVENTRPPLSVIRGPRPEPFKPEKPSCPEPIMEMHFIPKDDVFNIVQSAGAQVICCRKDSLFNAPANLRVDNGAKEFEEGHQAGDLIDVKELLQRFSPEEHLSRAEAYFSRIAEDALLLRKPFFGISDTQQVLYGLSALLDGLNLFPGARILDLARELRG